MMKDQLQSLCRQAGFYQSGWLKTCSLQFQQEIRDICKGNVCRGYGASWACPPAVGTVEECRERCLQYPDMLLFSGKYDLEDSFDLEGMMAGMQHFKTCVDDFESALRPHLSSYLLLSNEGCGRCSACTYPHAPCRFPDRLHHAIEGYGLHIASLAREAGVAYINGPNTVTYFGALLTDTAFRNDPDQSPADL